MTQELATSLQKFVDQASHIELPPGESRARPISQIYGDEHLSFDQQNRLVIQVIMNQKIERASQETPSHPVEGALNTRERFITHFREKAELINRAKRWIDTHKDALWDMDRSSLWDQLHQTVFPEDEYAGISGRQREFIKTIELGCAKFISDFEFMKQTRASVEADPRSFMETSFTSKLHGPLTKEPVIVSHPLAYICYVSAEDYKRIQESETGAGSFEHDIPDNLPYSGRVILISTGEDDPSQHHLVDRSVVENHEMEHSIYYHFFEKHNVTDTIHTIVSNINSNLSGDASFHQQNSRMMLQMFLEQDKEESVNYHLASSDMFASSDKGDSEAYQLFIEIIKNAFERSDIPAEQQHELISVYEKDFHGYEHQRKRLMESIDLLYYVGIEEMRLPGDVLNTMVQLMPVERIRQFIRVVLDIHNDRQLEETIRWYQYTPVREAQEARDKMEDMYAALRELTEQGFFDQTEE